MEGFDFWNVFNKGLYEVRFFEYSSYQELTVYMQNNEFATFFFYKKIFYKKMSLKNPKTLGKCSENLQPQMPELQF